MLYKNVLPFESVDDFLKCDHSNESYIEQYFQVVLGIQGMGTRESEIRHLK